MIFMYLAFLSAVCQTQNEVWSTAFPHHLLQSKGQGEDYSQGNGDFRFPDQHNPLQPLLLKMDVAETISIITMPFAYAGITAIKPELLNS